jgi:hypothetical protein
MASFRRPPLVQRMTLQKEDALLPVSNLARNTLVINPRASLSRFLGFRRPRNLRFLLWKRNVGEELPW